MDNPHIPKAVVHTDGIPRKIILERVANFRDLGGFETPSGTTQFGRMFRSDQLGLLTESDISIIKNELGITQVVDLRGVDELAVAHEGPLSQEAEISYFNIPVRQVALARQKKSDGKKLKNMSVSHRYFRQLLAAAPNFKKILTHLAENPTPTIFNCVAGRDRTGLVAMLLLGAVGVSNQDIIDDYAGTARVPDKERELSQDPALTEFWNDYIKVAGSTFLKTPEEMIEAMTELLQLLEDDYGTDNETGIQGYLSSIGVPLEKLKALLL